MTEVRIHPTAVVEKGAELDPGVELGPYVVVGPHVKIGAGTVVGAHAVLAGHTTLGRNNRIFPHAAVGFAPQDLKYRGEDTRLELGDENQIREFSTLNTGTVQGGGVTRLGNRNLVMAYAHVAHDCILGDRIVLANSATLAGHVIVEDDVIFGGLTAVHQFVRVGQLAFIAGGSMVAMDVPPYCTAQGDRARLAGINTVGLARHGFTEEQARRIKQAYRTMFRNGVGTKEGLAQLRAEYGAHPEIVRFVDFIEGSERGVTR